MRQARPRMNGWPIGLVGPSSRTDSTVVRVLITGRTELRSSFFMRRLLGELERRCEQFGVFDHPHVNKVNERVWIDFVH